MTYQTPAKLQKPAIEPIDPPRGAVSASLGEVAKVMPVWDVYFVLATASRLVKIGYAKDAWARFSNMQVGSPEELRMLGVIRTYLPTELERDLHAHFAADRVRGEWFRFSEELFDYVMQHGRHDGWDD
jgi:hypothetical protein